MTNRTGGAMTKRVVSLAVGFMLIAAGLFSAQHQIVDLVAGKVVARYQQSTCEQLWQAREKPKSAQEQEVIRVLRGDPQVRVEFIDKIAAPVVNKMFECGMVP